MLAHDRAPAASAPIPHHLGPDIRPARLAILAAVAAIGLAACGGGPASSRHVAGLGKSSGSTASPATQTSTSSLPKGSPTQLLNEWAACMRRHGDPAQSDPTITADKLIDITWNPATTGGIFGTNKGGQGNSGPGQYCRSYLNAAQAGLGGDQQPAKSPAQLLKYSECMRANGVANFPDPGANGNLSFSVNAGGDLNPSNPTFQSASKVCAKKTGVRALGTGPPPPGTIELNGSGPGLAGG
jgi:hypothetical protein